MRKKSIVQIFISVVVIAVFMSGCASLQSPSESNFKNPIVTKDSMEVAHSFGYWYFSNKVKPTKGKPDNVGNR